MKTPTYAWGQKNTWKLAKNGPMANCNIDIAIRYNLCKTPILAILTYSVHIGPIEKATMNKIQESYSKCHGGVLLGRFNENADKNNKPRP